MMLARCALPRAFARRSPCRAAVAQRSLNGRTALGGPPSAGARAGARARRAKTLASEAGGAEAAGEAAPAAAEMPSAEQLRIIFVHSAVPMIGFGFMDNMVMIQAGDMIDNTIGVRFGLATLAAAACGQIFSDVSGVAFGGVVEDACARAGLRTPDVTAAQRRLPRVKLLGTVGAIAGVVVGCCLGMTSLLFMDLNAAERQKRNKELDTIFSTVIHEGSDTLEAERSSLFLVEGGEAWTRVAKGVDGEIRVPLACPKGRRSIVAACVANRETVNIPDAYADARFDQSFDKSSGFTTRSILCVPIFEAAHEGDAPGPRRVVGAVQFINKRGGAFGDYDERAAKMLATHVAIFLDDVLDDD